MDIKEKVKNSVLFSQDVKEKISSFEGELPPELKKYIEEIFDKYGSIEDKIMKDIPGLMGRVYIKTIQDLENIEREKDLKELLELEKKILKL